MGMFSIGGSWCKVLKPQILENPPLGFNGQCYEISPTNIRWAIGSMA
jgi:hypothetical protein